MRLGQVLGRECDLELSEVEMADKHAATSNTAPTQAHARNGRVVRGRREVVDDGCEGEDFAADSMRTEVEGVFDSTFEEWWEGEVCCPGQVMERKLLAVRDTETIRRISSQVRILK